MSGDDTPQAALVGVQHPVQQREALCVPRVHLVEPFNRVATSAGLTIAEPDGSGFGAVTSEVGPTPGRRLLVTHTDSSAEGTP